MMKVRIGSFNQSHDNADLAVREKFACTNEGKAALGELCADLHGRGLREASDDELLEAVWQFRRDLEAAFVDRGHVQS